jgi:hypothetical protein
VKPNISIEPSLILIIAHDGLDSAMPDAIALGRYTLYPLPLLILTAEDS